MQLNLLLRFPLPPHRKGYFIVETDINSLTDEIYKKIAARILERKNKLGKTRKQITDQNSMYLLSNIMHNKRVKNRNPYLLNNKMIGDIVKNLDFNSSYELIWGSNKELATIIERLYELSLKYLQNKNDANKKLVEDSLLNYFPYAKLLAEYNYAIEPLKPEVEDIALAHSMAIKHLYFEIDDIFQREHKKYFQNKITRNLPTTLVEFITKIVPNILMDYLKTHNEGQTIYELISKIVSYESENINEEMANGPEWFEHQPLSYSEIPITEIRQEVINTGQAYIDAIINGQAETDPFYEDYPIINYKNY